MPTAINEFLLSLAAAIAAATPLDLENEPRSLWVHAAIEDRSKPVYTVLRIYGGDEPGRFAGRRAPIVRVQHDTRGADESAVLAQAWAIHESLLDPEGRPWMHRAIAGKRFGLDGSPTAGVLEADPAGGWVAWVRRFVTVPGLIGRDEQKRSIATGNVEIEFERA